MENNLVSLLGDISMMGVGIFLIILFMFGILVPVFVYLAQRYARKSYKELALVNDNLNEIIVTLHRLSKNWKGPEEINSREE